MAERDPIGRLYDAADDHEAAILDSLRIRTRLIWECRQCKWFNLPERRTCEQCAIPRPEENGETLAIEFTPE